MQQTENNQTEPPSVTENERKEQIEEEQIDDEEQLEEQDCFERNNIKPVNVGKFMLLLVLAGIFGWLVTNIAKDGFARVKGMYKITAGDEIEELSGLEEEAYRSYFYFRQLQNMAKGASKEKRFNPSMVEYLKDISFKQLFGLFKVVKFIQQAKNYSSDPVKQQLLTNTSLVFADVEILEKAYNYTSSFLPAANQYQCGSCYSFPITATIEYLIKRDLNKTVKLSEQQLIDCSGDERQNGCKSGNITRGFEYAMKVGLVSQEDYPYRSKSGNSFPCRKEVVDDPNIVKYKIAGFRKLPRENCQAIQHELSKGNVVASMISIGELVHYTESETAAFRNCPREPFNHAITIVGQTEKQEWIVRNSWGASWGKKGYLLIRGGNTCGICTHAHVPQLSK